MSKLTRAERRRLNSQLRRSGVRLTGRDRGWAQPLMTGAPGYWGYGSRRGCMFRADFWKAGGW